MKFLASLLLCLGAVAAGASAKADTARPGDGPARPADVALTSLADAYFDTFYFPENPSAATAAGIHRYDDQLEDYSRADVDRQVAALQRYQHRFEALDPSGMSERVRGDRELLLSNIRSSLLTLQTIRPWQKNPDFYSSGITASAFVIMERDFAPANERLRLLCAREKRMPAALRAAARQPAQPAPDLYRDRDRAAARYRELLPA